MIDVLQKKQKIISFLKLNGPALPVRIAKAIQTEHVLASAILSELLGEKRVKLSKLKIGTSALYLLDGQEEQLENFADSLKSVEKETYLKLKENRLLKDNEEQPATRVALRNIRDFAIPFKFEDQIMWRYAFTPEAEIKELLTKKPEEEKPKETKPSNNSKDTKEAEKVLNPSDAKESSQRSLKREDGKSEQQKKIEDKNLALQNKRNEISPIKGGTNSRSLGKEEKPTKNKPEQQKKLENIFKEEKEILEEKPEFFTEVLSFLKKNNIEFLEEIQTEKKELVAKVCVPSGLGKIAFLLIAKNKKTVSKEEIRASVQRATYSKMPCLMIIRKEPTKAIQKILEENNLIKILVFE